MDKKYVKAVAIIIVVAMVVTSFSFVVFAGTTTEEQNYLNKRIDAFEEYLKFVHDAYKDEVSYEDLMNAAQEGVTDALDPYSVYYPTADEAESFTSSVDGAYTGIGIEFKMSEQGAVILGLKGGGSALEAGLKEGDIITHVGEKALAGLASSEVQSLLMGDEGTTVKVTVKRDGTALSFTLTRKKIETECISYGILDNGVAYMQIQDFDSDAEKEFAAAKAEILKSGAKALVIDLRDNPGGYLDKALLIADQILAEGTIMHLEKRGTILKTYTADAEESLSLDMAVLVNEGTASAAEALAAALKENNAAVLVGKTTYGKGIAQQMYTLPDDSAFKLSVYYFLTPNKNAIQGVGVTPNVTVADGSDEKLAQSYAGFAPMSEKVKPAAGSTGLNVYGAQQRLSMLGYKVDVTGTMDAKTVGAVSLFQKNTGLCPYGVLDYTTMKKLDSEAYLYAHGGGGTDAQLEKALDLLGY